MRVSEQARATRNARKRRLSDDDPELTTEMTAPALNL